MIHDPTYGLAYGSNFTEAFANKLMPNHVREAMAKGVAVGKPADANASNKSRMPSVYIRMANQLFRLPW